MILGMGAAGLVLEEEASFAARQWTPKCELLGSHFLNSAFHASLLDREHIAEELERFITGPRAPHTARALPTATRAFYAWQTWRRDTAWRAE